MQIITRSIICIKFKVANKSVSLFFQIVQEEKGSTSGLKRTLSEGFEKDAQTLKKEGKRPKMEREELEAQLELKITAKAGSHHKLGKVCMQLYLSLLCFNGNAFPRKNNLYFPLCFFDYYSFTDCATARG